MLCLRIGVWYELTKLSNLILSNYASFSRVIKRKRNAVKLLHMAITAKMCIKNRWRQIYNPISAHANSATVESTRKHFIYI